MNASVINFQSRPIRLQIFTPFGSQLADVKRDKNGRATLTRGTEVVAAESIVDLTQMVLGVPLETDEIARWVQGDGLTENKPFEFESADGLVWRVTAEKFESVAASEAFPPNTDSYRFASRLNAEKGNIRVRLVIDEWKAL